MKTVFAKETENISVVIAVSDDRMKLFLNAERTGTSEVTKKELLELVKESAPEEIIHSDVIADVAKKLSNGEEIKERRIAKGRPPEPGRDGRLVLLVKPLTKSTDIQEDDKGFVDYSDLHLFDNIEAGDPVARVYPPKAGADGINAIGERLPAAGGNPLKVSHDKTLETELPDDLENQYSTIRAVSYGYLVVSGNSLTINAELQIRGNLDYNFGSLDFIGSVSINGDVMPGFKVSARDMIKVSGSVEGASLVCHNGDIEIRGSIIGSELSKIGAAGSVRVLRVQSAEVQARHDIEIKKESLSSSLRAGATIHVPAGKIIAGVSRAVTGIEVKELGTSAGTVTRIELAGDLEISREFGGLKEQIQQHEQAKAMLILHLGPYAEANSRYDRLAKEHRQKIDALKSKLKQLEEGISYLNKKKKEMLEESKSFGAARVNVLGIAHPGSLISIMDKEFKVLEEIKGPVSFELSEDGESIIQTDLKEIGVISESSADGKEDKDGK